MAYARTAIILSIDNLSRLGTLYAMNTKPLVAALNTFMHLAACVAMIYMICEHSANGNQGYHRLLIVFSSLVVVFSCVIWLLQEKIIERCQNDGFPPLNGAWSEAVSYGWFLIFSFAVYYGMWFVATCWGISVMFRLQFTLAYKAAARERNNGIHPGE